MRKPLFVKVLAVEVGSEETLRLLLAFFTTNLLVSVLQTTLQQCAMKSYIGGSRRPKTFSVRTNSLPTSGQA